MAGYHAALAIHPGTGYGVVVLLTGHYPDAAKLAYDAFEIFQPAIDAALAGDLDGTRRGPGPLDVLCQHILIRACAGPFAADDLYAEVRTAGPYADLSRADFDACLDFCATGGYALKAYDRWKRLLCRDGLCC